MKKLSRSFIFDVGTAVLLVVVFGWIGIWFGKMFR